MNFVCIVFEIGDKMLTLSSMENLIVQCNLLMHGFYLCSLPSVSPSHKKGHGKVLKKGHFLRAATCYEGTFKRAAPC